MHQFTPADDALIVSHALGDGTKTVFSRLHSFQRVDTDSPSFSIKFVLDGVEYYRVNQHTHAVRQGEFLLVNRSQSLEIDFSAQEAVFGLCLYVNEALIQDVYHNLTSADARLLDNPFGAPGRTFDFYEAVYTVQDGPLGGFLNQLAQQTNRQTGTIAVDQHELYYQTAERLLRSQQHVLGVIDRLSARNRSTRKELYRRVCIARNLMDTNPEYDWSVAELSAQAALSEFHFFRSFKQAFGLSPHQYLIQKRLQRATELLRSRQYTISEIAFLTGFSDIFSFSKAFKKTYRVAPSQYCQQ